VMGEWTALYRFRAARRSGANSAIIASFSTLVGDIALLSEKDIQWLGHVDLVIAGWPCQGMSMARKQNGL
jgi:site-specific DNA-cytosine methylase